MEETIRISAVFNQNIESPNLTTNTPNVYDLSTIITTTGLITRNLDYRLTPASNVSLDGVNLSIYNGAFGSISISVRDGFNEATADTEVYGYNAKMSELNSKDGFDNLKAGIVTAVNVALCILLNEAFVFAFRFYFYMKLKK